MNDLETIENYLTGQLAPDEKMRFEAALRSDPAVADALAFYVLARETAKNEARQERRAELEALRRNTAASARPLWGVPMGWAAAASVVLLLGLGWYFLRGTGGVTGPAAADTYIAGHFDKLSTTMSGNAADSLTQGVALYNDGDFAKAATVFRDVLTRQPDNDRAQKYAGITALRQGNYDQAIDLFHQLGQRTDLFANPGTFYEALGYLKRDRPMDKEQAKKLLNDVITKNLEGKAEAGRLIETLD